MSTSPPTLETPANTPKAPWVRGSTLSLARMLLGLIPATLLVTLGVALVLGVSVARLLLLAVEGAARSLVLLGYRAIGAKPPSNRWPVVTEKPLDPEYR